MSEKLDGRARLVRALRVREHALQGIATGIVVAAVVYLLFVAGRTVAVHPVLKLLLSVVLALTTAGVVTTVLVGAEAYKIATEDRVEP